MKKYKGKIHWVYRHLPLTDIHEDAMKAAEAAECAADQGKFWAYHDLLYQESPVMRADQLEDYAERVGVPDLKKFNKCLAVNRKRPLVKYDIESAGSLGFQGTPTFLIGRRVEGGMLEGEALTGAQPLDKFTAIIDRLLKTGGQ